MIELTENQLDQLLQAAAELGANQALASLGKIRPYLNKSEAFRRFGRNKVERWIGQALVTPRKDGGHSAPWRIDRLELESLGKAGEILLYF